MQDVTLTIEPEPAVEDLAVLERGLSEHALPFTELPGFQKLGVFARDQFAEVVGGISGLVNWNWLYVSLLWVDPRHRGEGLGSKLVKSLEKEAWKKGCRFAHLDTFNFQARDFYESHGYRIFGELDEYPPGFQRCFMKKRLIPRR